MRDEFINRLDMFNASLGVLFDPVHLTTWQGNTPLIFTTKVGLAQTGVTDLQTFSTQQGLNITGAARDKKREREELETAAFRIGSAVTEWFLDHNDETNAAEVDLALSEWQGLRDQPLLATATNLRDKAQAIVAGPDSATAATYGITAAEVTTLTNEAADFAGVITLPQQKITGKKSLTQQLRPRYRAVEQLFKSLDRLILQFGGTPAGLALIAAFQAARNTFDRGAGPAPPTPPGPGPTPPTPPGP